jgi:biopolymer transport protein ExbD
MAFRRRELKKTKIEIIPMIDTMFFLLVFFILASLNVIDMKGNQVALPISNNEDRQAPSQVTVTIQKSGLIVVNKTISVKPDQDIGLALKQALSTMEGGKLKPDQAIVVINADRQAPYAMVRRCIDEARMARFRRFSIATDPKSATP